MRWEIATPARTRVEEGVADAIEVGAAFWAETAGSTACTRLKAVLGPPGCSSAGNQDYTKIMHEKRQSAYEEALKGKTTQSKWFFLGRTGRCIR
jgi:hypothetical protein